MTNGSEIPTEAHDIVTRLRTEIAKAETAGVLPSWELAKIVWEAADEIAYLRSQIDTLQNLWEKDRAILEKYYNEESAW